jgi:allantoate deiminase
MIFVPSIGGISHNPAEATKLEDLVEGVKMMASALYELAYK